MNDKPLTSWSYLPGLGSAVLIAAASYLLALGHVALDPLVLSILISIIVGNLLGPYRSMEKGVSLSYRLFIPLGIILYGTQMDLHPLRTVGIRHIAHTIAIVFACLGAVSWLSRKLGMAKKLSMLLAAGSAICGASAIMVLSPVIGAKKEETSVSLLAITVIGLGGIIIYPLAQEYLELSERAYGLLCGSTLYQMGQVRVAASLLSQASVDLAIPVKLIRVGTLLPIAIIFSLLSRERGQKLFIPWFIVGSIVVAAAFNLAPALGALRESVSPFITFTFAIAIAGIGLTVDLESIIDVGFKPLLAVFLGWLTLLTLFAVGYALIA